MSRDAGTADQDVGRCKRAECFGSPAGGFDHCLRHLSSPELDSVLGYIRAEGRIEAIRTRITSLLLTRLLEAARDEAGIPVLKEANFSEAIFSKGVSFKGVKFAGQTSFAGARFGGRVNFEDATFEDRVWFSDAEFSGDCSFDNSTWTYGAYFQGARFSKEASFRKTDFKGGVQFPGAVFGGTANFFGASFSYGALFDGVKFLHGAWFSQAGFQIAQFDRARFAEEGRFDGSRWTQSVSFNSVRAARGLIFFGARFPKDTHFGNWVVGAFALFNDAEFMGNVDFIEVQVKGPMIFEGARFDGALTMTECHIETNLVFDGADCRGVMSLGPLFTGDRLSLAGTTFAQPLTISTSGLRLACLSVRFDASATFRVSGAEIVIEGCVFGEPSAVVADPEVWRPQAGRRDVPAALGPADAATAQERPRLLSLRGTDVGQLVLYGLDLSACLFDGAYNVDRLRIEGVRPFAASPPGWVKVRVGKLNLPLWRWTIRYCIAEEHRWRHCVYYKGRPGRRRGWYPPVTQVPEWARESATASRPEPSADGLARLYRSLRQAEEDRKNEPGAADFYYGEMEMRRFARETSWGERVVLFLYWLVSGYSLRGSRSLACLAAIILGLAALLVRIGFVEHSSFATSVIYAAQATLSIEDRSVPLTGWGNVVLIALRLAGPLFLGLAVLSVRNRVKR